FFFFFQAEDGIRDRTVTGVQTCALPISRHQLENSSQQTQGIRHRPPRLRLRLVTGNPGKTSESPQSDLCHRVCRRASVPLRSTTVPCRSLDCLTAVAAAHSTSKPILQ